MWDEPETSLERVRGIQADPWAGCERRNRRFVRVRSVDAAVATRAAAGVGPWETPGRACSEGQGREATPRGWGCRGGTRERLQGGAREGLQGGRRQAPQGFALPVTAAGPTGEETEPQQVRCPDTALRALRRTDAGPQGRPQPFRKPRGCAGLRSGRGEPPGGHAAALQDSLAAGPPAECPRARISALQHLAPSRQWLLGVLAGRGVQEARATVESFLDRDCPGLPGWERSALCPLITSSSFGDHRRRHRPVYSTVRGDRETGAEGPVAGLTWSWTLRPWPQWEEGWGGWRPAQGRGAGWTCV
ncbi:uncharacterized protein LOC116577956 [Mustela erminea]|uniref:uncharacterized protein LOC116577956 n=1 Tax=Mustela erminea TaxID=36723 RepID=UPI001386A1DC|nr:uncharacterized protein LOC116577956 [Mustela erminea]